MSDELTVGEIRRALAQGRPEQTVREALTWLAQRDEVDDRHARLQTDYAAYLSARLERRASAEQEAMDELDRERNGRPWPTPEARARTRREAGLEARDRFEEEEPLLGFTDWVESHRTTGRLGRLGVGAT